MSDEAKLERGAQVAQSMRELYAGPHQVIGHAYVGVTASGELHWGSEWTGMDAAKIERAAAHLQTITKHATQFAGKQRAAEAKARNAE